MIGPDLKFAQWSERDAVEGNERRGEPRFHASGEVRLIVGGHKPIAIPGRILDISQHGMRVEHMYPALTSGMMLEIESGHLQFTARVVWNRIKNDTVESGIYLL